MSRPAPTDSDANARVSAYVRGVFAQLNLSAQGVSLDLGRDGTFMHRRIRATRNWTVNDLDELAHYLTEHHGMSRHGFLTGATRALIIETAPTGISPRQSPSTELTRAVNAAKGGTAA